MNTRPVLAAQPPTTESVDRVRRPDENPQPAKNMLSPPPSGTPRSFAERKAHLSRPIPSNIVEGDNNMRDIDRPPPGDVSGYKKRTHSKPELTKKRSHYFEEAFAVKENSQAKDRVLSESIVMADVKTNVIVSQEPPRSCVL